MTALRIGVFLLFTLVVPLTLGLVWTNILPDRNRYRLLAMLPMGFFTELAIFHLLAVPFAFLNGSFSFLCILFAICIALISGICVAITQKTKPIRRSSISFSGWEMFYLAVFLILLGWQLYNGLTMDATVWTYDDSIYVGYAADALRFDRIHRIDTSTGLAINLNAQRCIQSSLIFPAMLSFFSGIPVTVMERTALETYFIFLAYTVYAYMAAVVCEKKENGLSFLIILSVLHIFGFYSQYSITFRLLGPNYQGKAILAVSLIPFLFTFLIQKLQEDFDWKSGMLVMFLSISAVSLSMFGVPTMALNTTLVVVLSLFRKERCFRHLKYIPWACVMPAVYGGVYFIYRYLRW